MKRKSLFTILLFVSICVYATTVAIPESVASTASQSFHSGTKEDINTHIRGRLPWTTPTGTIVTASFSDGSTSRWVVGNMRSTIAVTPIAGSATPPTSSSGGNGNPGTGDFGGSLGGYNDLGNPVDEYGNSTCGAHNSFCDEVDVNGNF